MCLILEHAITCLEPNGLVPETNMARMTKYLMGLVIVATVTGGMKVQAAQCFNDDVKLELSKITTDTQEALHESLMQQVDESRLKEYLHGQFYKVSQLAAMCGGESTAEGQQILQQGNAFLQGLLIDYQSATQNANGNFGEAKVWKIGVERSGGGT